MEIIVQGKGESFYTPDQVVLNLNFNYKENDYEQVLEKGSLTVSEFINTILLTNGFVKEDMKTNNFTIRKETKYNEQTRTYDFAGYSYNQNATIKFDYDKDRLSKLMESISKLKNPPFYKVDFTVKNIENCKKDNLTRAYQDAESKARIIAEAAGLTLKGCTKVDFKPFTTDYISHGYDGGVLYETSRMAKMGAAETINEVFTPEDVKISETLYCLWIAG